MLLADCRAVLPSSPAAIVVAAHGVRQSESIGDTSATAVVYTIVAALVLIGVLLVALAIWLTRQTRPDRELLAPLEHMASRRWRALDPQDRRRALDEVRPADAEPIDRAQSAPDVDRDFAVTQPVRDFADLADRDDDAETDDAETDDHGEADDDGEAGDHGEAGDAEAGLTDAEYDDDAEPGLTNAERPGEEIAQTETPDAEPADAESPDADPAVAEGDSETPNAVTATPHAEPETADADRKDSDTVVGSSEETDVFGVRDPLVIDTVLADPTLLEHGATHAVIDVAARADAADSTSPLDRADDIAVSDDTARDDTGEHANEAELEVPLMPGEGILKRPRTDADQR